MDSWRRIKQPSNPRSQANIFSKYIFFGWLLPFLKLGCKKDLEIEDVYSLLPEDGSEKLGLELLREWKAEVKKSSLKKNKSRVEPSLSRAIWATFGIKFMLCGLLAFMNECGLKIAGPLCLGMLIQYFHEDSMIPTWQAYAFATGVVLCAGMSILTHHPYFFGILRIGMKIRVASCSLIYKKSLLLSQKALGQTTIGQMVNLLSNDVSRFNTSFLYHHYLWIGPLQALISLPILYHTIGPSCLVGFSILILFIPLQAWMGKVYSLLRMRTAHWTDERIRMMNEIISGMRVIKMYTWENPFTKLIEHCRKKEIGIIRRKNCFDALNISLFYISSKIIVFLTCLVYVVTGNLLTAEKVFVTISLFNNIRTSMTMFIPNAIMNLAESSVSIKRIEKFLLLDEVSDSSVPYKRPQSDECGVDLTEVTVKWPIADEQEGNTLKNISFGVKPGQVLAIVGHVGSGKSSLLNIITGELSLLEGSMSVRGKIAYASQEAWVFSGTVRQNILCGLGYDVKRYKEVIRACALEKDLSLLPDGDQTTVGDRGVSLSGGQKARLNLARALYIDADIYLLDDPLSAVDAQVGRHLFDRAITGYLCDKIRILVTHQLQYLPEVDRIVVLKEGQVDAIGTFYELQSRGKNLDQIILRTHSELEEDELERPHSESEVVKLLSRSESSNSHPFKRRESDAYKCSISEEDSKPKFTEESRSTGSVSMHSYWLYWRAGASCLSLLLFVIISLITQVLYHGTDYWLALWTNTEELRYLRAGDFTGMNTTGSNISDLNTTELSFMDTNRTGVSSTVFDWIEDVDTTTGVYVYSILTGALFVFSMIWTVRFFLICISASVKLHNKMFESIIRSQPAFFDRNPVGRILNRFSKDIGCVDELLPPTFYDMFAMAVTNIGTIVLIGVVNLWLILPLFFLVIIFHKLRKFYLESARDVKRLEATSRSPVFTHISSSLNGLVTLRVHQMRAVFQHIFDDLQDVHSSTWFIYQCSTYWFGLWLDCICFTYIACIIYICVPLEGSLNSSEVGLVISSAMMLTSFFQWSVRQSAEVENQMISVERVIEYSNLKSEAKFESPSEGKPPSSWPLNGAIQFDRMSLRYSEEDEPVLKNITCFIQANEKVGIVGRTGAGKSSLIAALFRLTEPEGRVLIDGINTKSIGLHELRSKISIIPQDPILFSGTLRRNLDPFNEYQEETLWTALKAVNLKEFVSELTGGLDSVLTEGGSNLSVGQKQLVCLARAILKRNRILVLDEATANVDQKTDSLIQLTIRDKFKDCTVLTIAHRLNTIMDSDRVMLLDSGCLKEFDEPAVLLQNPESLFYGLVKQTGSIEPPNKRTK